MERFAVLHETSVIENEHAVERARFDDVVSDVEKSASNPSLSRVREQGAAPIALESEKGLIQHHQARCFS